VGGRGHVRSCVGDLNVDLCHAQFGRTGHVALDSNLEILEVGQVQCPSVGVCRVGLRCDETVAGRIDVGVPIPHDIGPSSVPDVHISAGRHIPRSGLPVSGVRKDSEALDGCARQAGRVVHAHIENVIRSRTTLVRITGIPIIAIQDV